MANVIYGSEVSKRIKEEIRQEVSDLVNSGKRQPTLAVVLVGDNPASLSYVKGKDKACHEVGFGSLMITLEEKTSQEELHAVIDELNDREDVDGILVQMPLPKHLNELMMIERISPNKDVDGLHPINVGKLHLGLDGFVPCTPLGCIELLDEMKVDLCGKRVVVVGRSKLVGGPVSKLLMDRNATVTTCHSKTKNIESVCKEADVLVACLGVPHKITKDWIKEGAYVIDVGINRVDGKLLGDVDFDDVIDHVSAITPVPKGVGPMTIAMLLKNTLKAYNIKEQ